MYGCMMIWLYGDVVDHHKKIFMYVDCTFITENVDY